MSKKIEKRWDLIKLKIDEIILPLYLELSKRLISFIEKLECPSRYLADILRDLADAIMTSYPKVKEKDSIL